MWQVVDLWKYPLCSVRVDRCTHMKNYIAPAGEFEPTKILLSNGSYIPR